MEIREIGEIQGMGDIKLPSPDVATRGSFRTRIAPVVRS